MASRFKTVRYSDMESGNESPKSARSSKTVIRSFRSISPSLRQQLLEGSSPITPISPGSFSEQLDRLDGILKKSSPRWHAPKECSPVESESRHHRLTIRRPTKALSRVALRGLRSSRSSSRAEDESPLSPRPKSPVSIKPRTSFRTPITEYATSLSERDASKFKRHTLTMGNKNSERSTFLDYSKFKDGSRTARPHSTRVNNRSRPSIIESERSEAGNLETRIRQDLQRYVAAKTPTTPTKLDPSIVECGTRSCKKDESGPPDHSKFKYGLETLIKVREDVARRRKAMKKAESMSPLELPAPVVSPISVCDDWPGIYKTSRTAEVKVTQADGSTLYDQSITRDHSPVDCIPSRASRPPSYIEENRPPRSSSKLNPLAREFTTMKYQPPAKRFEAYQAAQRLAESPLTVPKQRQSQSNSQALQNDVCSAAPQGKTEPKPISSDKPQLKLQIPVGSSKTPICVGNTTKFEPQVSPEAETATTQPPPSYTSNPTSAQTCNGRNAASDIPPLPSYPQQVFPDPTVVPPNIYNVPYHNQYMSSMQTLPPVFIGPVSMPSALQVAYSEGRLPIYMNNAQPQAQQQPMHHHAAWPHYDYGLAPKVVMPPPGFNNLTPKTLIPTPVYTNSSHHSARVANAMGAQLATPLLERFVQRFPNTGKPCDMSGSQRQGQARTPFKPVPIHVKAPTAIHPAKFNSSGGENQKSAQGRKAALIQQRLEFLLMQNKEKKAFEALQDQILDLEACGVEF